MAGFPGSPQPPPTDLVSTRPVPVFPLPGVFLFPVQVLPLHVFEPRYRQMIADSLDGPGRMAVATVREAHRDRLAGDPPFEAVAGLGEIARHQELADGRYLVWLYGLARVRLREVPSDRMYRQARCEPLVERPVTAAEDEELRPRLVQAIRERTDTDLGEHGGLGIGTLADVLAQATRMPEEVMVGIHATRDPGPRARQVLAAHDRYPVGG